MNQNNNQSDKKKLFFGVEAHAPWPESFRDTQTLRAAHRHMTLAFLGEISYCKIKETIPTIPRPQFLVGPVAMFDSCLYLSNRDPEIVTWHVDSLGSKDLISEYQEVLTNFLEKEGYHIYHQEFLKHVTLGRSPFPPDQWKQTFRPLPVYFKNLHLYEGHDSMRYEPIWTYDFFSPFEIIKNDFNIVFTVFGEDFQQIYLNAQIALSFQFQELFPYLREEIKVQSLEEIFIRLNKVIEKIENEMTLPFDVIILSDQIKEEKGIMTWDMTAKI